MPLPNNGPLSFSTIANEIGFVLRSVSLRNMSNQAGFSTPDAVSEFYGFTGRYEKTLYAVPWNVANGNPCGKTYNTLSLWTDKPTLSESYTVFDSSSGSTKYSIDTGAWLSEDLINWRYYDSDGQYLTNNVVQCSTITYTYYLSFAYNGLPCGLMSMIYDIYEGSDGKYYADQGGTYVLASTISETWYVYSYTYFDGLQDRYVYTRYSAVNGGFTESIVQSDTNCAPF